MVRQGVSTVLNRLTVYARLLLECSKPRIILLLAITSVCGALVAAKGNLELLTLHALLGGTLSLVFSAGGANMVNMWWDRDIDPLMKRTQNRPIPTGKLAPRHVLIAGVAAIVWGFILGLSVNLMTGLMALSGALFYVLIYTMLLKRNTVQNIVIGGAAGAFPPLVGWASIQGDVAHPLPWLMFMIIFLWTPPHFWALALMANEDYTRAKVPMYPVVHGEPLTRLTMLRYFMVLVPVTLLGGMFYPLGPIYMLAAIALAAWWGVSLWRLLHAPQETKTDRKPAQIAFTRSLFYLALVFLAMVVDSWI